MKVMIDDRIITNSKYVKENNSLKAFKAISDKYLIIFIMCGRTGLSLNVGELRCACAYRPKGCHMYVKPDWLEEYNDGKKYIPSFNIAPTDVTPVLISATKLNNAAQTDRVLKPMMWGIIPPWHKNDYRTHNLSTNNCRLENIRTSKLYNPILNSGGRCIIIVEGFYEWQTTIQNKTKQPYYIYATQFDNIKIDEPETWSHDYSECDGWNGIKLLYMAGLYNVWQQNNTIIYSYSVITMESNDTFNWLHHRMPAILDSEDQIEAWLDVDNVDPDMALAFLTPVKILSWHRVSTLVNNSRNKSEDCNKKITEESKNKTMQKPITAWFTKGTKRLSSNESIPNTKKMNIEES